MRKAADDVLQQRRLLKVKNLSPSKGSPQRANEEVLKQRKIIKAKRSSFGSTSAATTASSTPTHDKKESGDDKVLMLKLRATLFTRVDAEWVKRARGTLYVYKGNSSNSGEIRWIELICQDECILNLLVEQMVDISKLVKESKKGIASYIRFSVEKRKAKELLLIQVVPESLDTLYSTLRCGEV